MKKKLEIALAEDNRFHAIIFEQAVLEKYPEFQISTFTSGNSLFKSLHKKNFDLIAVDFNLPDIDGLELLSMVRANQPDIPFIIITGVGNEEIAVEAMKAGATDYITKSGDYGPTIPRVIKQAYQKQRLILKNRRLAERTRKIEQLETITAAASTLNHEINNPLMGIIGNIELLLADEELSGDEEILKKLKAIEKASLQIQEITHMMANLIEPTFRQTPVGPMLKLKSGKSKNRRRRKGWVPAR